MTGQREIVTFVTAAVLLRDDVLDVKREVRINSLVNPALLAAVIRPRTNEPFCLLIHYRQARLRALIRM